MDGLDLPRVAAIGLAKRIEEVFVPGRSEPIVLPPDSPALLLLQRIRDEAHRFALKHHRRRARSASGTDSLFERLPGVGPAPQAGAAARTSARRPACSPPTADELEAVPGLPRRRRARSDASPEQDRRRGLTCATCDVASVYEAPGWGVGEVV